MCTEICESRKCHQRLTEKRHGMRSNVILVSNVREKLWNKIYNREKGQFDLKNPTFDLLVAVESLQRYVIDDLDKKLLKHDMITVKGTRKHCQHCCCE